MYIVTDIDFVEDDYGEANHILSIIGAGETFDDAKQVLHSWMNPTLSENGISWWMVDQSTFEKMFFRSGYAPYLFEKNILEIHIGMLPNAKIPAYVILKMKVRSKDANIDV